MSKTYMQKEDSEGERSGAIICVPLSDWSRYRQSGYAFVETDADGSTPEQQFVAQDSAAVAPRPKQKVVETADEDEGVSMDNTKDEIIEYLEANDIEYASNLNKADLLDLIE